MDKPRRLPSTRRAVAGTRLAEINHAAATTGDDPELDTLLLRLHTETACRRGGALALRPQDLDPGQCLILLREKGETVRWQPVSPTLMAALLGHAGERHAPPDGQLLRYRNGRRITYRRYDHLWDRLGRYLPWVRAQQISMHWIRHTTLTWVERNFGIRRQRPAESLDVEVPACGQLEHALAQAAAGPGEALDHAAGQGLQPHRPGHPELGQLTPPQIGGAAGEASRGEGADHGPQGPDIQDDRAAGIRGPVRVDQVRQACGQVTGQTRAGQVVQVILGPAAVAEHAPDAQGRLDDHRRHQAPPSQGSPLNSSAASLSAPVSPASPAAAPAPSYACR